MPGINCIFCGRRFVNAKIFSQHSHFPGMDLIPMKKNHEKNGIALGLSLNNQRNACTKCKSNENSDKSKNCDKCRKIRLTKMSEKIGRNKIKKNCWTCQRCKRKFNQMAKLMFHKQSCPKVISKWRPNPCKMCCKVFLCKSTLERHVQVMHSATKISDVDEARKKKCYVCKISLQTIDNILEKELANDLCKKCTKIFTPTLDIKRLNILKPSILKPLLRWKEK